VDNGPEFISNTADVWAYARGIKLHKPVDNCNMDSFDGKFKDSCVSEDWYMSLKQVRKINEAWWVDYTQTRPHSSLENLTLAEFKLQ
jgi:putative transposase